jgi:hypothetical protein
MVISQLRLGALFSFTLLLISACNRPVTTGTVQPGADIVYTAAAQTVEAQLTSAASGQQPTFTPLPLVQSPTPAPPDIPTATQAPTTPSDSPEPTADATEIPCDRASFVSDVTIPDGTELLPGESFEKTWRLRNNGSCTWDANYSLIFAGGDAMGGPAAVPFTSGSVAPDQEVDVSVNLIAPLDPGTFRGDWRLRNAAGQSFGIGAGAEKVFWVEIVVPSPTAIPSPGFDLSFYEIHECASQSTVILQVDNTGNAALDSSELTILDLDAPGTLFGPATDNGPFMGKPVECPPGGDTVEAGKTKYVGGLLSGLPSSGTNIEAKLKLCTQEDLGGACIEKTVNFTIP